MPDKLVDLADTGAVSPQLCLTKWLTRFINKIGFVSHISKG